MMKVELIFDPMILTHGFGSQSGFNTLLSIWVLSGHQLLQGREALL
jgi:hypothetical protein